MANAGAVKPTKTPSSYGDQSITQLKGADRVRRRPAVIFGSDGLEGCSHSFFEILSNSVDEAREGFGNIITVTAYSDHSIEVDDRGRGVPLGWNEKEERFNWDLIYCELYAGGKYDNNSGEGAYEFSLGLNGLGACATQCSSEYMQVRSYNGRELSEINFKRGNPDGELSSRPLTPKEKRTGTNIRWKPDLEVFTDIAVPREFFIETLKRQAVVNSGITFVFKWQTEKGDFEAHEFVYENGILDRINEIAGDSAMTAPILWKTETSGRDRADKPIYKLKIEAAFACSNKVTMLEYYHNSSFLEYGGSPDKACKSAFVSAVDKYLKTKDKYKKNESKIIFSDIEDCLLFVVNSFSTQTSYENQTKKAINNTFIAEAMTEFFKKSLEIYFAERPLDAERFTAQVLVNKRSRESAESTRLDLKKKLGGSMDIATRIEKFVTCRTKDPELRELYIVEGDSALTSCKLGRAAEFQAIMAIRGKTLNCLKFTYDKIFKSEIITDLLKVIGCGVEISGRQKTDHGAFDIGTLRWNKIVICTDADEDGFHIRTLLLTMFYRLLPTLIKEGKVYIAESPLFEVTTKEETFFAYNEKEKLDILKKLDAKGKKYGLQRSKGLGENEPEMMWKTTMNPETRRLIRVTPSDAAHTYEFFDMFLGDNIAARKDFIARRGSEYVKDADV